MSNVAKVDGPNLPPELVQQVLIYKNTRNLSADQKVTFLNALCSSLGMNPLTSPFEFLNLNGKEIPYAKRDATDQLRRLHDVSIERLQRETVEGVYVVTASAKMPSGRTDESVGAVPIAGLRGDALANAMMKAETKAKRRVTLSICGLGFLDETEVETIPEAQRPPLREIALPQEPQVDDEPLFAADDFDQPHPDLKNEPAGAFKITFGKYQGSTIQEVFDAEKGDRGLIGYIEWLEKEARKKNKDLSSHARFLKVAFERFQRDRMVDR